MEDILSQFFEGGGNYKNSENLIEILCYRFGRFSPSLYEDFLNPAATKFFLGCTITQLIHSTIDEWSSKIDIITNLFETTIPESRLNFANALVTSKDLKTSKMGKLMSIPKWFQLQDSDSK